MLRSFHIWKAPYIQAYPSQNKRGILHLFFWDWRHKKHKIALLRVGVTLHLLHMFRFMIMFTHVLEWIKPMSEKHSQNVKWECGFTLSVKHFNMFVLHIWKHLHAWKMLLSIERTFRHLHANQYFVVIWFFKESSILVFFNNLKVENHQLQFFEKK